MKKIALSLVLACITLVGFGQDDRPFRIGFSILPSVSSISPEGDNVTKLNNSLGFAYGVLADVNFGEGNYAFATGLMINSLGATLENNVYHDGDTSVTTFGKVEEKYKLQYIQIPLTLKLKTNEIGYLSYFGQFGLDLGFNIRSKADYEGTFDGTKVSESDVNVSDFTQPLRVALNVGAGAEYNISGDTYLVGALVWNNGLTNLFSEPVYEASDDDLPIIQNGSVKKESDNLKAINNYFGLSIAVFF